jgi:hypothetical protein
MPLARRSGAGLEGVRLRLTAWPFRKEYDVTATLEVEGGRSFVTIGRVDAWPSDPHINSIARKHSALRHLPAQIDGHHVHRFGDNALLGRGAFAPMSNLPVAAPIEDRLQSFRDFLRIVGREFRIDGLSEFTPPRMAEADLIMSYAVQTMTDVAERVANTLVRLSMHDSQTARVSTPLLFPGGTMIGVEFSRLRDGFLVTDAGAARREAGMLGGERTFVRLAGDVAQRYGVRFDQNMIFDMEVAPDELAVAIISVANAAKSAVEMTALHLATTEHSDYRAMLWSRLERIYEPKFISRNLPVRGSSDEWRFDAVVNLGSNVALFELVAPHPNAVSSAVTKFLDIRDLGEGAPQRIAVLTNKDETPHLPVLARTARVVSMNDPDDIYRQAA